MFVGECVLGICWVLGIVSGIGVGVGILFFKVYRGVDIGVDSGDVGR